MAKRSISDTRNIAVLGHSGAGKTTFVDHLLHVAGATNRAGSVVAGTSLSDYDPEERERKFSIESSIFSFQSQGKNFTLVDTPGYLDFCGAALAAIPPVETALIAVSAPDGIQLNTRRMWDAAGKTGVARVLLLTRLDADNISLDRLLADIQESLGTRCLPAMLPVGLGPACKGVVNLLEAQSAPEDVQGDFDGLRDALREAIIECNDDLMERYLEGKDIPPQEFSDTFKRAIADGRLVPVLCCAAEKDIGLKETLSFLADCAPSPLEGLKRKAADEDGAEVELAADSEQPLCAQVFKVVMDVHVGKLVFLRIFSGSLAASPSVKIARTGRTERLGHYYRVFGAEHTEVDEALPGDIICVPKVEELQLNDVLSNEKRLLNMAPIELVKPMMSLAVEPKSRDDEQKIGAGLHKLAEADPTLRLDRDQQTAELVITGMSDLHLHVLLSKLKSRYGVSAETREPSIPYRETITKKAEGQYRHKKQTGGRGQFGEVHLRLEPNERGKGFEFVDETKGGVIPQQYMPAIEKGIVETLSHGILAGCPIVDVKAAVFFGSYHTVDSSEAAFKIAGSRAFQRTFEECGPVLLEPIARIEVTVPTERMGDVTGSLTGRRGRIQGMDQVGRSQVLIAEMPMAEVRHFSTELQSVTGGEGTFTLEFSHYEAVPTHVQQRIIEQRKAARQQE